MTPNEDRQRLVVLPSSATARRSLGHLAWAVLEVLALRARLEDDSLIVDGNVRTLAAQLGVGKDTAASAVRRLVAAGLVHRRLHRSAGRYAPSVYRLDSNACRRAGVRVEAGHGVLGSAPPPCPPPPCPSSPDMAVRDTGLGRTHSPDRDLGSADSDSRPQLSLFDLPAQTSDHPLSPNPAEPDHHQTQQASPTPTSFLLTTPNRPDALAPGMLPPAFSRRWELNGNLSGGCPGC